MNKDVCMKRSVFVILLGVLVLAGCATPKTNADGSPYWTTHTPKSTRTVHYEVGSAKQSTPQLSQLRTESAAKDAIFTVQVNTRAARRHREALRRLSPRTAAASLP